MKRKREKHITRLHIILFFLFLITILIIFFSIKHIEKTSNDKYKEYEKEIERVGQIYYKLNDIDVDYGFEYTVDIKELKKQNLITEEITDDCKGYLVISMDRDIYSEEYKLEYKAYIKCSDKYRSVNYSDYYNE